LQIHARGRACCTEWLIATAAIIDLEFLEYARCLWQFQRHIPNFCGRSNCHYFFSLRYEANESKETV
jgi:hypothetical protein